LNILTRCLAYVWLIHVEPLNTKTNLNKCIVKIIIINKLSCSLGLTINYDYIIKSFSFYDHKNVTLICNMCKVQNLQLPMHIFGIL